MPKKSFNLKQYTVYDVYEKNISNSNAGCSVALGCFDGVHTAHRSLLFSASEKAISKGLYRVCLTIETQQSDRLTEDGEKTALISPFADRIISLPLSDIKDNSCEEFAKMLRSIGAKEVFCGYNFSFGRGKSGGPKLLGELLSPFGTEVNIIPEYKIGDISVSSSAIRSALKLGDVKKASLLLGRDYGISGIVRKGLQNGSKMGFPTANLIPKACKLLPLFGVYRSKTVYSGKVYDSMTDIGIRPTFSGHSVTVESHMFDFFGGETYNKPLEVYLIDFIRPEMKFSSAAELQKQLECDAITVKEIVSNEKDK